MIVITMENGKQIHIQLEPDKAPMTVKNFEKLVSEKFYDGLTFHRIIPGFMIQGGCPDGTGMGGPGYSIRGERIQQPHQTQARGDFHGAQHEPGFRRLAIFHHA